MEEERLLTVQDVANYLQLKNTTIYHWIKDGKIPAIKIGGVWRFRPDDIEEWIGSHTQGEDEADEEDVLIEGAFSIEDEKEEEEATLLVRED